MKLHHSPDAYSSDPLSVSSASDSDELLLSQVSTCTHTKLSVFEGNKNKSYYTVIQLLSVDTSWLPTTSWKLVFLGTILVHPAL